MKFTINKSSPSEKITIGRPMQISSGLYGELALEAHALGGAIVIMKKEMKAVDAIDLMWSLCGIVSEMVTCLHDTCGPCDECGCCEIVGLDDEYIRLPEYVLEEAGLPSNCKLAADVADDGTITISKAGHDFDLTDVPPLLLELFKNSDICLRELEEQLMAEGAVCGGNGCNDNTGKGASFTI